MAALEFEMCRRADPSEAWGPRPLDGVDPDAIERAVTHVGRMTDGELLALRGISHRVCAVPGHGRDR